MIGNKRKPKKCKACNSMFTPDRSFQSVCNPKCAIQYAKDKAIIARDKKLRSEIKTAREALKTRSDHLKDAQTDFNAFIRERDRLELCISCGRNHNGQYHAGHYRSVGAAPHLRFNEDNCHKQCSVCNNHKSGNAIEYRINLVKKIGVDRVEAIECNNEPAKLTIDQIKEIRKAYKKKLKEIKET